MSHLALQSLRVRNFKAIRDTGLLKPKGLTVFIGDNGSGKSSVIEALRFARALATGTLDDALTPSGGFEHLRWKGAIRKGRSSPQGDFLLYHPVELGISGRILGSHVSARTRIVMRDGNEVMFAEESLRSGKERLVREASGFVTGSAGTLMQCREDRSLFAETSWFDRWQFIDLVPGRMGDPIPRKQTAAVTRLQPDGSNLSEYLLDFRDKDLGAFEGLLEALQVVLPYATDLIPEVREAIRERSVALWMQEGRFKVPGWMLSTGTLRVLCLLALLRHPNPPTLLCVEEIENGLDPRTIQLLVDELLRAIERGRTQVMLTTHSPYLLDLMPLESLVLVAREPDGPPSFRRPADEASVREWAKTFAPGRLYTMGNLDRRSGP